MGTIRRRRADRTGDRPAVRVARHPGPERGRGHRAGDRHVHRPGIRSARWHARLRRAGRGRRVDRCDRRGRPRRHRRGDPRPGRPARPPGGASHQGIGPRLRHAVPARGGDRRARRRYPAARVLPRADDAGVDGTGPGCGRHPGRATPPERARLLADPRTGRGAADGPRQPVRPLGGRRHRRAARERDVRAARGPRRGRWLAAVGPDGGPGAVDAAGRRRPPRGAGAGGGRRGGGGRAHRRPVATAAALGGGQPPTPAGARSRPAGRIAADGSQGRLPGVRRASSSSRRCSPRRSWPAC